MLSISTLQIQSAKNIIKNDRTLPKTNSKRNASMRAIALKTVSHVFNLLYKAPLIPTIRQKKSVNYLIYKRLAIFIRA